MPAGRMAIGPVSRELVFERIWEVGIVANRKLVLRRVWKIGISKAVRNDSSEPVQRSMTPLSPPALVPPPFLCSDNSAGCSLEPRRKVLAKHFVIFFLVGWCRSGLRLVRVVLVVGRLGLFLLAFFTCIFLLGSAMLGSLTAPEGAVLQIRKSFLMFSCFLDWCRSGLRLVVWFWCWWFGRLWCGVAGVGFGRWFGWCGCWRSF